MLIEDNMKHSVAFETWTSLFTVDLYNTWTNEITDDLRPLSMLMYSIKHEMKKIQDNLDRSVLKLQNQHRLVNSDKTVESTVLNDNKLSGKSTPVVQESTMLLFNCSESIQKDTSSIPTTDTSSLIISDDDMANTGILGDNSPTTSPEIKKKKRFNFSKRHKQSRYSRTPSPNILQAFMDNSQIQTTRKSPTIIDEASSIDILQFHIKSTTDTLNSTPDKNSTNVDDFDNSSVVQCTPTNTKLFSSKRKEKSSCFKGKSLTLKKMVLDKAHQKKSIIKSNREDHVKGSSGTNSGLTELVDYMNDNISSNIPFKENRVSGTDKSSGNPMEVDREVKDIPKKNLNDFLKKAHNFEQLPTDQGVIRGKARKNLPGWSCQECERFYLNQGLNTEEIVKLSKCSRHRGYAPREDTVPGFWDMTMSTEDPNIGDT